MIALKSYLIRAVRDWAIDQGLTPHIVVDAFHSGTLVPPDYVHDGRIVLNIVAAVLSAYARENGQGISFGEKETAAASGADDLSRTVRRPRGRPEPKLIK